MPLPREAPMSTTTLVRIQPLADRVVIKVLDDSQQMRAGLHIPDTAKEKPSRGEVVAVGPGRISEDGARLDMGIAVGDRVTTQELQEELEHCGGTLCWQPASAILRAVQAQW